MRLLESSFYRVLPPGAIVLFETSASCSHPFLLLFVASEGARTPPQQQESHRRRKKTKEIPLARTASVNNENNFRNFFFSERKPALLSCARGLETRLSVLLIAAATLCLTECGRPVPRIACALVPLGEASWWENESDFSAAEAQVIPRRQQSVPRILFTAPARAPFALIFFCAARRMQPARALFAKLLSLPGLFIHVLLR